MSRRRQVPSYRLHKQSGQAIVTLPDGVGSRRDVLLGPFDSPDSHAEYARVINEWLTAGRRLPPTPEAASGLYVSEVLAHFWEHAQAHYPADSREPEQFRLSLRPLRRLYGHTPAADFGPKAFKAVRQAMVDGSWMTDEEKAQAEKRKQPIGWCRNVVNRRMTRVKTFFKWAESEELVPPATFHALQTVRGLPRHSADVRHSPSVEPADWSQLEPVLPHCPAPVAAMLRLQWWAGMRSCEVRLMRTRNIDRSDSACWFYTPSDDDGHPRHKNTWRGTGQRRVVPLGPRCQEVLRSWLRDDDPDAFLFSPRQAVSDRNARRRAQRRTPRTPSQKARKPKARPRRTPGACYTDTSYAHAVAKACARAGVKFHPYALRHGCKMRIEREASTEDARCLLGQKSIQATTHYGQLDIERARNVATKLA